jgi:hypothetical protein
MREDTRKRKRRRKPKRRKPVAMTFEISEVLSPETVKKLNQIKGAN